MVQGLSPGEVPDAAVLPLKEEEWRENLNVKLMCRDCREDPPELYEDHASGDLICANCGLVLQERAIDQSSEWRTFANDDQGNDDPSRVGDGPNALLNGGQLYTGIAFDGGMRGRDLNRAQNRINADKGNKGLMVAYKQIGALCEGMRLSNAVADTAKHIFKDAEAGKQFKGKGQDALIASCIFLSCRRNKVERSFREVTELTRVSKKELGRTFKQLQAEMIKNDRNRKRQGHTVMLPGGQTAHTEEYTGGVGGSPAELCGRYCNLLGMDQRAANVATEVATRTSATGIVAGRSPTSVAAACVYMAGLLVAQPRSAKEIHAVAHVSDSTIRQVYKLMYQERDKIVGGDMLERGVDPSKLLKPS